MKWSRRIVCVNCRLQSCDEMCNHLLFFVYVIPYRHHRDFYYANKTVNDFYPTRKQSDTLPRGFCFFSFFFFCFCFLCHHLCFFFFLSMMIIIIVIITMKRSIFSSSVSFYMKWKQNNNNIIIFFSSCEFGAPHYRFIIFFVVVRLSYFLLY